MLNDKMTSLTTVLSARIKLKQRHLIEWYDLISQQKEVWKLISKELAQKVALHESDKTACYHLKKQYHERLIKILEDQNKIRREMKEQRLYESFLLERSIEALTEDSE